MARKSPATDEWLEDAEAISDDGERVSHLVKDFTFYGHLSIYDFATQFCRDAIVLDAGSAAGYGAALVADAGARHVLGVDVSPKAVEFSRHHDRRPNLEFEVLDLDELALPPDTFDFIFTSNTLEHVADVPAFLGAAHTSLKPAGAMLVAVDAYLHGVSEDAARHSIGSADDHTPLSEKEFAVTRAAVDDMYTTSTLTAIFIARAPRPADALPDASAPLGFVDDSLSRRPGQIDPELEARLEPYFDEPAGRATAPAGSPAAVRRRSGLARRPWFVWRTAGSRAFVHKTFEVLGRRW